MNGEQIKIWKEGSWYYLHIHPSSIFISMKTEENHNISATIADILAEIQCTSRIQVLLLHQLAVSRSTHFCLEGIYIYKKEREREKKKKKKKMMMIPDICHAWTFMH
jgi:hypothetical protein